ncbi:MAG: hypothetical protein IJ191_02050 [Treponema sp.]|nr:hypothetical protein [Treponema sp.]
MKRTVLLVLFGISVVPLCAVTAEMQYVVPYQLFVGDRAELYCTFACDVPLLTDDTVPYFVAPNNFPIAADTDAYTIESMYITKNGDQYQLSCSFRPWTPGTITFPPIDVVAAVRGDAAAFSCVVAVKPVTVQSLLGGGESLHGPHGPILLPGTVTMLYLYCAGGVCVCTVLIVLAVRWQRIRYKGKKWLKRLRYAGNVRRTLSRLNKLVHAPVDDPQFCTVLERIVRTYLEIRTGYVLSAVTTAELRDVCAGNGSERAGEHERALEMLGSVFCRADGVRFAIGAVDYVPLASGERTGLISRVRESIALFEAGEA